MKRWFVLLSFFLLVLTVGYGQRIGDGFPGTGNDFSAENYGEDLMQHLIEADQLIRRYRWEDAILAYDKAIAQDPWFSDAYLKRALLLYKLGRNTEAIRDLEIASRLNPFIANIYGLNGRQGQLSQLAYAPAEHLEEISLSDEGFVGFLSNSLQCKLEGNWACAEAGINNALASASEPVPPLLNVKGNLFLIYGKYFSAIEAYTEAIQIDPRHAPAYYNRGIAKFLALNRVSACDDLSYSAELGYEKAIERLPYLCNQ